MKNFEKHSLEEILTIEEGCSHPAIVNGKMVKCVGLDCGSCDLSKYHEGCHSCAQEFLFWLYSEADPEKEENKNDKEIEDLRKAAWYINRRIEELLEKENDRE